MELGWNWAGTNGIPCRNPRQAHSPDRPLRGVDLRGMFLAGNRAGTNWISYGIHRPPPGPVCGNIVLDAGNRFTGSRGIGAWGKGEPLGCISV